MYYFSFLNFIEYKFVILEIEIDAGLVAQSRRTGGAVTRDWWRSL